MFGLGLLTYPTLAAAVLFAAAVFAGQSVVIEQIDVSEALQARGYSSAVVTRQFIDELRKISDTAGVTGTELSGLEVEETDLQQGIAGIEEYFPKINVVVHGTRNLLGLIPYYVESEITEAHGQEILTTRLFTQDENKSVHLVVASGDPNAMETILHEAAIETLEHITPYLVVSYYRQTELAAGQFDFPKTQAAADRFLASQPVGRHYLIYALLGRMHMMKAEGDKDLTPDQKQAEFDAAMKLLESALKDHEKFLYPCLNIGLIHAARGENDLAERYFARAVEINPNYLLTRKAWGDLLVKEGRPQDAVFQYVAAVEIDREDAELRDKLARAYQALGQTDAAREEWQEALRISPTTRAYVDSLRNLDDGSKGG